MCMCTVLCIYDIIYILQETGGGDGEGKGSHEREDTLRPPPLKSWLRPCVNYLLVMVEDHSHS